MENMPLRAKRHCHLSRSCCYGSCSTVIAREVRKEICGNNKPPKKKLSSLANFVEALALLKPCCISTVCTLEGCRGECSLSVLLLYTKKAVKCADPRDRKVKRLLRKLLQRQRTKAHRIMWLYPHGNLPVMSEDKKDGWDAFHVE
ncbi:unnamed protein product [Oncorhynchus mykiss]|uniref:Chemokine interleukin-8-like domain-containing protein n=1 Tax=Oncorhynchus mykiss TaxID=8022 RepID=A0A060WKJ7_ONCMY|nr:unnamed protein product [Oncorhynchus mykiss]